MNCVWVRLGKCHLDTDSNDVQSSQLMKFKITMLARLLQATTTQLTNYALFQWYYFSHTAAAEWLHANVCMQEQENFHEMLWKALFLALFSTSSKSFPILSLRGQVEVWVKAVIFPTKAKMYGGRKPKERVHHSFSFGATTEEVEDKMSQKCHSGCTSLWKIKVPGSHPLL